MNWRTASTVAGMTVCTVGGSYAVNLASSGGRLVTVLIFLTVAVVLTGVQVFLQLRNDSQAGQVSNEDVPSDCVRIRTEGRIFIGYWVGAIALTFAHTLLARYPYVVDWIQSHDSQAWIGLDWLDWDPLVWILRAFAVLFYLFGLIFYWWYRKGWLDVNEFGIERSSRFIKQSIVSMHWDNVDQIYWDEKGALLVELNKADTHTSPYRLLDPENIIDEEKLHRALTRFAGVRYVGAARETAEVQEPVRRTEVSDSTRTPVKRSGIRRPPNNDHR